MGGDRRSRTRSPGRAGDRPRRPWRPATDGRAGLRRGDRCSRRSRIARELGARPLLRELEELAARARITIPDSAAGGPADGSEPVGLPVAVAIGGPTESGGGAAERGLAREFVGPARPRSAAFGLSPREREVLLLLAAGRTNREIGEHLFISQKTVGVHVGNILSKLGVSGRVEAAAVAIRLGLTERR